MKNTSLILLTAGWLAVFAGAAPEAIARPRPADARKADPRVFRMGFTGFVPDITPPAALGARKFVRENGDIIAHHIEGVPWAESLRGGGLTSEFLDDWAGKKTGTPARGKVYLAISPGRGDLKVADHCAPLPAELKKKGYEDPLVKRVYLAYCQRAVNYFKPDYLCIGIEVNELYGAGGERWRAYWDLHRHIYESMKKDHPNLPVFASFTLHNLFKKRELIEEVKKMLPWNDLIAISYYPFFVPDPERLTALDWIVKELTPEKSAEKKPFAMVETNDAAERLPLPQAGVVIEGTPEKQRAYYERLLALAQERRFEFVISFVHQDYDRLWDKIRAQSPELFMAWKDCGFIDEFGEARPALAVWKDHFSRPLAPGRRLNAPPHQRQALRR